jgi:O-antigen/teichoic acid export membrane protein
MIKKAKAIFNKYKSGNSVNSLMLAFTQSLIAFVFIFVDFIFSKKLNPTDFGSWKQMFFIINLLIPILSFGIPEGYKYYIAKEEEKKDKYFSNMLFMILLTTTIGVVVFLFLNLLDYVNWISLKEYYLISILFPIGFLVFNLNKALRYSYINTSLVWLNTKITTLYFIPTFLIIGFISIILNDYINYYLWIGIFIFTLIFGMPLFSLLKFLKLRFSFYEISWVEIRKMLKIGLPLYLATFIGFMIINIDKGIVSIFENKATFAIFSIGATEIPIFAMLSAAFSQQTYPSLVRLVNEGKQEEAKALWIRTTINVSYITYPMIFLLMVFAKPILFFIYTNEYQDSIIIFQIYLLTGLFRNNYYGALITASGKTKLITYYSLLTLLFNLIFSTVLFYFLGIIGIVYGTLFSVSIIAFLQLKNEGLLRLYFSKFVFNKVIIFMILIIIISFVFPW